jgi:hypothetical protein
VTTFSASTLTQAVPAVTTVLDPSSIALLGLGLFGIVALRKKTAL